MADKAGLKRPFPATSDKSLLPSPSFLSISFPFLVFSVASVLPDILYLSVVFSIPSLECHHHEGRCFISFVPGTLPNIAEELSEMRKQGIIGGDEWKDTGDCHKVALDKEARP